MTVPTYNATGGSNAWATPRDFLTGVVAGLGLEPVALDLAASPATAVAPAWFGHGHPEPARRDALAAGVSWAAVGTRWLNPPYGRMCTTCPDGVWRSKGLPKGLRCADLGHGSRTIADWMRRVHREAIGADRDPAAPLLVLTPLRGDGWWMSHVVGVAARVWQVDGRLRFLEPDETGALVPAPCGAPFPSVVLEYRPGRGYGWRTQYGVVSRSGEVLEPAALWPGDRGCPCVT